MWCGNLAGVNTRPRRGRARVGIGAPRRPTTSVAVAAALAVLAACGSAEPGVVASPSAPMPTPVSAPAPERAPAATVDVAPRAAVRAAARNQFRPQPLGEISAATTSEPAQRTADPIDLAWIGGSEVEWNHVSLPAALATAFPMQGDRPVVLHPYTRIAPMPEDIVRRVERAVVDGADALLISMHISWITWEEPACEPSPGAEVDQLYRYVCVLTPISDEVTARRAAALREMVDAVVATGLPAYLYLVPHSTTALEDRRLADLIAEREAELASYDPGVPHVEFYGASFTRGLDGFAQPTQYFDMVHPTALGAEAIAGYLAAELDRFLGEWLPAE